MGHGAPVPRRARPRRIGKFDAAALTADGAGLCGPFFDSIRADGVLIREPNLGVIGSDERREHCILRSELPAKQHLLRVVADEIPLVGMTSQLK